MTTLAYTATAGKEGPVERLRRNQDVRRALRAHRRVEGRHVDVHLLDRGDDGPPRVTAVAGKRVGSAVRRNRAKRRLRAAARTTGLPAGCDAVLMARPGVDAAPFSALLADVLSAGAPQSGRSRRG